MSGFGFLIIFLLVVAFIFIANQKALANGHDFKTNNDDTTSSDTMTFDNSSSTTLGSDYLDNTTITGKW